MADEEFEDRGAVLALQARAQALGVLVQEVGIRAQTVEEAPARAGGEGAGVRCCRRGRGWKLGRGEEGGKDGRVGSVEGGRVRA